jgi:hypothetical protein
VPGGPARVSDADLADGLAEAAPHRHGQPQRSAPGGADVVAVLTAAFGELDVVEQHEPVEVEQSGEVAVPGQVGGLVSHEYLGARHQQAIR